MLQFEEYLQDFNNTVDITSFLINLILTALLALILRWFYARFGHSVSNRSKFGMNFVPLALTTFLIISVIKSSLALSLGLVGALSIVRFRAAIKDPEELTYLFLTIAIGLVTGADKPILAALALACILPIIYFNQFGSKRIFNKDDKMFVNINTDVLDLGNISEILKSRFDYVELKRMDQRNEKLDLTYICNITSPQTLDDVRKTLSDLSDNTSMSFVDKPDLMV